MCAQSGPALSPHGQNRPEFSNGVNSGDALHVRAVRRANRFDDDSVGVAQPWRVRPTESSSAGPYARCLDLADALSAQKLPSVIFIPLWGVNRMSAIC